MTFVRCCLLVLAVGCGHADAVSSQMGRLDGERVLADLQYLAADALQGRAPGTEGSRLARERIRAAFAEAGLNPLARDYESPFALDDGSGVTGTNVVAMAPGVRNPDRVMVVTAHYDHLGPGDGSIFNGADDNASGTAALLAFARYFGRNPPDHSVVLAAFDAEEKGLRGARAFVAALPSPLTLDRILVNVNLDMISHSDSLLYVAGTHHSPFLRPLLEQMAVRPPVALRYGHDEPTLGSDDWTSASDHAPFHRAGVPFVYFGVEDHPDYHQPTDHFETINPDFYVAAVETILDAVLILDRNLDVVAGERGRGER